MMPDLVSFSGRIGRSEFIRWSALQVGLSALLLTCLEGFSFETVAGFGSGGGLNPVASNISIMLVLGLGLVLLPSSALLVKRLRDVGLPAWPCLLVITVVDILIADVVPHSVGYTEGPFAGLAFEVVITVLLAFVPGRSLAVPNEEKASDWVKRALEAETRLMVDRRRQAVPGADGERLEQLQALESIRRQGGTLAGAGTPQAFGRRHTDRI